LTIAQKTLLFLLLNRFKKNIGKIKTDNQQVNASHTEIRKITRNKSSKFVPIDANRSVFALI
jgi:hypothetical protein